MSIKHQKQSMQLNCFCWLLSISEKQIQPYIFDVMTKEKQMASKENGEIFRGFNYAEKTPDENTHERYNKAHTNATMNNISFCIHSLWPGSGVIAIRIGSHLS